MRLHVFLILVLAALTACERSSITAKAASGPITTPAKASDSPALRLVRERRMGQNLGTLAWDIARASNSLGVVAEKYGADKATAVMAVEIQKLVPKYIERWEENMADAYAHQLTADELTSIAKEGRQSPHFQKLMAAQSAVGQEMRTSGRPIVEELVTKAFSNAIANAP